MNAVIGPQTHGLGFRPDHDQAPARARLQSAGTVRLSTPQVAEGHVEDPSVRLDAKRDHHARLIQVKDDIAHLQSAGTMLRIDGDRFLGKF